MPDLMLTPKQAAVLLGIYAASAVDHRIHPEGPVCISRNLVYGCGAHAGLVRDPNDASIRDALDVLESKCLIVAVTAEGHVVGERDHVWITPGGCCTAGMLLALRH